MAAIRCSFGAVLFEMAVTGRQAFYGATTAVIYDAILNRAPAPNVHPQLPLGPAGLAQRMFCLPILANKG